MNLVFLLVMVYCRAAASDYDDWETVHGNKGWGSKSLIPLLRKVCLSLCHSEEKAAAHFF
jgi:choline dehydrogenase-like flavoprotein